MLTINHLTASHNRRQFLNVSSLTVKPGEVVAIVGPNGAGKTTLLNSLTSSNVSKWLTFTDTHQFSNTLYPKLSGGEKQRVHLARVLLQLSQAKHAPLLLLDEPTSAQDIGQQHAMLSQLKELAKRQKFMIVMILHDLNLASRFCDTVWLLQQGKLYLKDTPEQVLTPETIETVWGYRPQQHLSASGETVIF